MPKFQKYTIFTLNLDAGYCILVKKQRQVKDVDVTVKIPDRAKVLIDILCKNGYKAYAVGGCVRDSILGRTPNDWDICTSATPKQMLKVFSRFRVIETGISHGTVTVLCDAEPYEITTFRIDGSYSDNRRPDFVSFTSELEEDLLRRDFTINAMAYNEKDGLCDPYGGKADIENKVIRCVGQAKKRFEEDALRILRALRFSCQLEFDIEEETARQIHLQKERLKNVSAERICTELCKMLVCPSFFEKLERYRDVFCVFIPQMEKMIGFEHNNPHHIYDVFMHTVYAVKDCPTEELVTKLALLLHDIGKPYVYSEDEKGIGHFYSHAKKSAQICDEVLKNLKFDNVTRKDVTELVLYHDTPVENTKKSVKKWLGKIGQVQLLRLMDVKEGDNRSHAVQFVEERIEYIRQVRLIIDEVLKENECFSLKDLAVKGDDIINAGCKKGKRVGEILAILLDEVICENVSNDKESLIKLAKELIQSNVGDKR